VPLGGVVLGPKTPPTVAAAFMVTEQDPVPVQASVHILRRYPVSPVAVRPTTAP
jgi:hypothetical protein